MLKKITVIMLIAAVFLVGCAKKEAEESVKPDESITMVEEEEETTEELEIIDEEFAMEEEELLIEEDTEMMEDEEEDVFKVQLFATYDEMKANKVKNDLQGKFSETVYVEYIAPYYKVRVGEFSTKAQAENLRDEARSKGYSDAFIVLP